MSSVAQAIIVAAQQQGIDPSLALEVANAESGMNPNVSDGAAGEIGIFQILPSTAAGLGINARDPQQNIQGGVTLLRQLLSRYGDPAKALAAYNWGPGSATNPRLDAVLAVYGSDWFSHIPSSTQAYINKILGNLQSQYTPAFNPASSQTSFVTGSTLAIPPASDSSAVSTDGSIWGTVAFAVAIVLGIGFVLSES